MRNPHLYKIFMDFPTANNQRRQAPADWSTSAHDHRSVAIRSFFKRPVLPHPSAHHGFVDWLGEQSKYSPATQPLASYWLLKTALLLSAVVVKGSVNYWTCQIALWLWSWVDNSPGLPQNPKAWQPSIGDVHCGWRYQARIPRWLWQGAGSQLCWWLKIADLWAPIGHKSPLEFGETSNREHNNAYG